jgi:high-affinity iron transporter
VLATFVIGLREGLEASLIIGIIAAFLGRQGRRDALRQVWIGVGTAVVICVTIAVVLRVVAADLPDRGQEGLETVVGALAVAMVTSMIVWMRRHARELKGQLEGSAAAALAAGSASVLVAMAFLAVLREGFETSVFVLAVLNQPGGNAASDGTGVILGILVAVVIGWGIYRGGVKLNLAKFFKATGIVLVLVAAGLVMTALHTAHETGWINFGQQQTVNLTWLVRPGTPVAALLTGVFGLQERPVVIEVVGWFAYAVPLVILVARPPKPRPRQPVPAASGSELPPVGAERSADPV